jgi:tetratricopeptide (TPR) repeat protein
MFKALLILSFFFVGSDFYSQRHKVDSLLKLLEHATADTAKCVLLYQLTGAAHVSDESAYAYQLIELCENRLENISPNDSAARFYKAYLGSAYNVAALNEEQKGNITRSLDYHNKSMKLKEETNNPGGIANTLGGIGLLYYKIGDIPRALEYFNRGLSINEQIKDTASIALSLGNIAMVYRNQKEYSKALEYMKRCIDIYEISITTLELFMPAWPIPPMLSHITKRP